MKDVNDVLNLIEDTAISFELMESEPMEQTEADTPKVTEFEPFPVDQLPGILAEFVKQTAKSIGCDETFVVNPLLAALAGAIGNTRQLVVKGSDWDEPAILWTCNIGNSGDRKSPPFRKVKAFFNKIEQQAQRDYEQAESQYKADMVRHNADLKRWSKSGSSEPLEEPTEPRKTRYVINDATTEAVTHCLGGNPRGLVLMRDELSGWFNAFGQYKNGDADSPFWLECYEAGTYSVDRRGIKKPVYIPRCSVSLTGTTQPATLQRFLENGIALENGMLHRFLLAYPPERATQWTAQEVAPKLIESVQNLFDELLSLGFYLDSSGREHPENVYMTPDARKLFEVMFNQYGTEKLQLPPDLKSVWSKMPGKIARLALIFHSVLCVTGGSVSSSQIDAGVMRSAIVVGRWYANETSRVYSLLGCDSENEESRERREILDVIRNLGGSATIRGIGQKKSKYRDEPCKTELEKLLRSLVSKGKLYSESKVTGGRPTEVFFLVEQPPHRTKGIKNTENNGLSFCATESNSENAISQDSRPGVILKKIQPKKIEVHNSYTPLKEEGTKGDQQTLFK